MNHPYLVSAAIQLVPVQPGARHPYGWIDEVIDIIKAEGVLCVVGSFSTSFDADYKTVMNVIDKINQYLITQSCPEWLLSVQMQIRSDADITAAEKIDKHK